MLLVSYTFLYYISCHFTIFSFDHPSVLVKLPFLVGFSAWQTTNHPVNIPSTLFRVQVPMNMLVYIPVKYRQKKVGGKPTKSLMFQKPRSCYRHLVWTQPSCSICWISPLTLTLRARREPDSNAFLSAATCSMCVLAQNERRSLEPLLAGCIRHLTCILMVISTH